MLYQEETNGEDPLCALEEYISLFPHKEEVVSYAKKLLQGIEREKEKIDEYIKEASLHWKFERITLVDRNILRIGIYEMLFSEDVPPISAIDEAIELGKKYGSEDSKDFINGILDHIFKFHYRKGVTHEG